MGFKKNNYKNEAIGITLPTAYAQITNINIQANNVAFVNFTIQQDRNAISTKEPFEIVYFNCDIDKSLPIYEQIYLKAKENIFVDWEDDIVE